MNNNELFPILLQKYLDDSLTSEEYLLFKKLLLDKNNQEVLEQVMKENYDGSAGGMGWNDKRTNDFVQQMVQSVVAKAQPKPKPFSRYSFYWAAAAVMILVFGTLILYRNAKHGNKEQLLSALPLPGKDGAILTLSDGRQLVLDSLGEGTIATESGSRIVWEKGQLLYKDGDGASSALPVYNTISTPAGRQFHVVLPDGSNAWLNAGSSVRYPTYFKGGERVVDMTGEVFFEVAQNSKVPFIVKTGNLRIEDLGTAFNVNAYADEASVNTTLVSGMVKVSEYNQSVRLTPGQQSQYSTRNGSTSLVIVSNSNIDEVIAWTKGLFHYENTDIKTILRQISRWYNISIRYRGEPPADKFFLIMKRSSSLTSVLRALQTTGIQFQLEGQYLYVGKP